MIFEWYRPCTVSKACSWPQVWWRLWNSASWNTALRRWIHFAARDRGTSRTGRTGQERGKVSDVRCHQMSKSILEASWIWSPCKDENLWESWLTDVNRRNPKWSNWQMLCKLRGGSKMLRNSLEQQYTSWESPKMRRTLSLKRNKMHVEKRVKTCQDPWRAQMDTGFWANLALPLPDCAFDFSSKLSSMLSTSVNNANSGRRRWGGHCGHCGHWHLPHLATSLGWRWHVCSTRWLPLSTLHSHHVVRWCWAPHPGHREPRPGTSPSLCERRHPTLVSSTGFVSNVWSGHSSSLQLGGYFDGTLAYFGMSCTSLVASCSV